MKLKLNIIQGDFGMQVQNADGQSINFDANPEIGGLGFGVRPMEAVASSLAACASIDILLILKKQRIKLKNYQVDIVANRQNEIPALFNDILLQFSFEGNLDDAQIQRAVDLSLNKYCSVAKILESTCNVNYSVRINNKPVNK